MRTRQVLLLVLASAVLLEVVLQVGALAVWWAHSRPAPAGTSDRTTVLCVGDSYTFGVGASAPSNSYPAVLERLLRSTHGDSIDVANCGRPGQDSRDVLLGLDQQLQRFRPAVVCILVGCNDAWNHPKRHELPPAVPAADATGPGSNASGATVRPPFHWRWRTRRLFLWLFGNLEQMAPHDPGGGAPTASAPVLSAAGAADSEIDDSGSPLDRGWRRAARNDWAGALAAFRSGLSDGRTEPDLLGAIVRAHVALGEAEQAGAIVEQLERRWSAGQDRRAGEVYLDALNATGRAELALRLAEELAERWPDCMSAWAAVGHHHAVGGDSVIAERALDRAIALIGDRDLSWRAGMMRSCARAALERNPQKSAELMVDAFLLDGDLGPALASMRVSAGRLTRAMVERRAAELTLGEQQRAALRHLFDEAFGGGSDGFLGVLADHLIQAIARCRARGAVPIVLTYPMAHKVEALQRGAGQLGVDVVDVRARFDRELLSRSRDELFVVDGHCNDAGYAIVAELVAEVVRKHLR
jgi:lysophospholipase L1-like esterase/tetratricopeptide (TPR) repeat protein